MARLIIVFFIILMLNSMKAASQLNYRQKVDIRALTYVFRILPPDFYNLHLGYFCKRELEIQKSTNLNLFFRLGSKDYVDQMEHKTYSIYK